jgi:nucleotide-binding universal stress UspA family protein
MSSKNVNPDPQDPGGPLRREVNSGDISRVPGPLPALPGRVLCLVDPAHPSAGAQQLATQLAEIHRAPLETVPRGAGTSATAEDLVVVERRSWLMGSLPLSPQHKLLVQASGPVLLVPAHAAALPSTPPLFRTVLCAVEFSDSLTQAVAFAGSFGGRPERMTVLHVLSDMFPGEYAHGRYHFTPTQLEPHLEAEAKGNLERLVGHEGHELVVLTGKPAHDIHQMTTRMHADLLVLAGPFEAATIDRVVGQSSCPVLVVPQTLH